MGRKEIRRINPNNTKIDSIVDEELPLRWKTQQSHHQTFLRLIGWELEDELAKVEERWKRWSKEKLKNSGLTLFDVVGRKRGRLFGEQILIFNNRDKSELPWHKFSHGDIVLISRKRPWDEKITEGIVLDRNRIRIRIVVSESPDGLRAGTWRIDRGANKIAHDRMKNALETFHSTDSEGGTILHDLLLGNVMDISSSASRPPNLGVKNRKISDLGLEKYSLNSSQIKAINAGVERRLSLIQGPPGTGKTHTAIHLLKTWVKLGRGPILATADSNVAVDNLLEGLIDLGINAVRIGQPVKVREKLRKSTLYAKILEHPNQEKIEFERDEIEELQKSINNLKGREKGLAHRDINRSWKEIRKLEKEISYDVLDNAQIVCATCIGAGHEILDSRKFPLVLIDEATQATEPASIVPLVKGARQVVLIGDHRQLPATVISAKAESNGLGRSLFERLINLGLETELLDVQYRMHSTIREFPSSRFYENEIKDGHTDKERATPAGFIWPNWNKPIAFVPIEGAEQVDSEGTSKSNMDEAGAVVQIIQGLLEAGELVTSDIGIITPYNGQVRLISDMLEQAGGLSEGKFKGLEVKSIDGYQGREKELIVFSTVRANKEGEMGFLSDQRRLNVALTRARRGMIVIGCPNTLRHNHTWSSWIDWVQESGLFAWHAFS